MGIITFPNVLIAISEPNVELLEVVESDCWCNRLSNLSVCGNKTQSWDCYIRL